LTKKLDIFLLTETWQVLDDFLHLNILTPEGYTYMSWPQLHGKGGGLTVTLTQLHFHTIHLNTVYGIEGCLLKYAFINIHCSVEKNHS